MALIVLKLKITLSRRIQVNMINLTADDRKQLIILLQDLPELDTERGRQQILELAGLKQLTPKLDLSGSPFVAVNGSSGFLVRIV